MSVLAYHAILSSTSGSEALNKLVFAKSRKIAHLPSILMTILLLLLSFGLVTPTFADIPQYMFFASDAEAYDYFSQSVSICGNYAIVGNAGDDNACSVITPTTSIMVMVILPSVQGKFCPRGWSPVVTFEGIRKNPPNTDSWQ